MLSSAEIEQFIEYGFVAAKDAFPRETAEACREHLWRDTGCDPHDRTTWTRAVVRLGNYVHPPFVQAANTQALQGAFDQLVGRGRWLPCMSVGSFVVRF